MKGQQVDMHARSKNFLLSYNMHLFLPYLLNDFQTIRSTIHFSKPKLICGDWSDWSCFHLILPVMPDKEAFVSAVLHCVQRYRGNSYLTSLKVQMCIFIQTNAKTLTSRQICKCFILTSTWTAWDSFKKKWLVSMIQRWLFLLRDNNLYTVHFQILNLAGCFLSLRAELHAAWKVI